jgi:hypothetical protein
VVVRSWHRALLGALLVGAVAAAGIALNFSLLRLTQDAHDPVGKLSPRAVFSGESPTTSTPGTTTTTTTTTTGGHESPSGGGGKAPAGARDGDD